MWKTNQITSKRIKVDCKSEIYNENAVYSFLEILKIIKKMKDIIISR